MENGRVPGGRGAASPQGADDGKDHSRVAGAGPGNGEEADTARRLIQAGRKLFATRGFDGTSVRALTAAAGTNLGAVTYHFESKEELYRAVLNEVLGPVRELAEMLRGMHFSAPQLLEFFIRGMFQNLRETPDLPRFFVQEVVLGEEPAPPILETLRVVVTVLTGIIQEGQSVGTLRAGDPVLLALSTLSQPIYLSLMPRVLDREDLRAAGLPRPRTSPEEHAVDFVMKSLLAKEEME